MSTAPPPLPLDPLSQPATQQPRLSQSSSSTTSSSSRVRKRPVSFGNPALGTYKGFVYTVDSSTILTQPPQIIEDAELVERMVAMVDVPPEQVPEGVLNLARSHRPYIDHVRIVIAEPSTSSTSSGEGDSNTATAETTDPLLPSAAPGVSAMESAASILAAESESLERQTQQQQQQQIQQPLHHHDEQNDTHDAKPSRTYLVLFHLLQPEDAQTFVEDLNGQPFTSLDMSVTCTVQHVVALRGEGGVSLMNPMFAPSTKKVQHGALEILPSSSSEQELTTGGTTHHQLHSSSGGGVRDTPHPHHIGEDPNCAVCLERVALDPNDADKMSILTTVCNHTFHLACLVQCQDSPCPVCRYDHSGLNEALSQCHVCGTTEHNYVCLICGVVSCVGSASTPSVARGTTTSCSATDDRNTNAGSAGTENNNNTSTNENHAHRFFNSHAGQHYDETLHAYALDTETQHVWDFCGQGYVHRLLQNKDDGKLVEVHDPNNTTSQERSLRPGLSDAQEGEVVHRKLEGFASQYYTLLKSQLEQQRIFYQGRLQELRREFAVKQQDAANKNKMADLLTVLKQERKQLTQRSVSLKRRHTKVMENVAFLKSMNESLEANKAPLQLKIEQAQRERMESQQMIQKYLPALEEKVTTLMLQLEESTTTPATTTGAAALKECAPDTKRAAAR